MLKSRYRRSIILGTFCGIALYGAAYSFSYAAGMIDFAAVAANKPPIFANISWLSNQGSVGYEGFGYKVIAERNWYAVKNDKGGYGSFQDYGANLEFKWTMVFPKIKNIRRDLEFHVPTSPPREEVGQWDPPIH